jgi:hypothetical protein
METWKSNKRPCEEEIPINLQRKRAAAITVATTSSPLLPQPVGYYSSDSHVLDQRRFPPLSVLSDCTSAESPLSRSVDVPQHAEPLAQILVTRQHGEVCSLA